MHTIASFLPEERIIQFPVHDHSLEHGALSYNKLYHSMYQCQKLSGKIDTHRASQCHPMQGWGSGLIWLGTTTARQPSQQQCTCFSYNIYAHGKHSHMSGGKSSAFFFDKSTIILIEVKCNFQVSFPYLKTDKRTHLSFNDYQLYITKSECNFLLIGWCSKDWKISNILMGTFCYQSNQPFT